MAEILIIKLGALGDLVLAEGALRDLRAHHAADRITLMTAPAYGRIMARCPWLDDLLLDERPARWRIDRLWRLRQALQARRFAKVYDLQNSHRTNWYYRYLFPELPWSGTAPGCSDPLPATDRSLGTARLANQLQAAGVPVRFTRRPELGWLAADAGGLLRQAGITAPYAVLVAGSSARNQAKRWPHFAELAAGLAAAGCLPVTVPGPDELAEPSPPLVRRLLRPDGSCLDLFELAGVLQRADLVVGNDTGPTLMAACLAPPTIVLFGSRVSNIKESLQALGATILERPSLAALDGATVLAAATERLAAQRPRHSLG